MEAPGGLMLDFETMNEADVREIIVRPLVHRLRYRHGTDANIRTEVHIKYPSAFLGRKKAAKDPPLVGRADYICEVISHRRWVVEVKAPGEPLGMRLTSRLRIIGGTFTYAEHESNTPLLPRDVIEGLQLPVVGGFVDRSEADRIRVYVEVGKAA